MQQTYFIGYDAREHIAAGVCAYSILRRTTRRARIYALNTRELRALSMFDRPWEVDPKGQAYDKRDTRPFSTGFSHTRFLVFHIAQKLGITGPCMFMDCDFLFLQDPTEVMIQQADQPDKIGVVMRDRQVEEGSTKMDGVVQQNYARKLWSAMFTFTPNEELAHAFRPSVVNNAAGRALHGFLDRPRDRFWSIPEYWHVIPSLDDTKRPASAIHYSEWSPWLNPERRADYGNSFSLWEQEHERFLGYAATCGTTEIWHNLRADLRAAR